MRSITALCASVFAVLLLAMPASAAVQEGLVNVNVEDNTILVPLSVAANVCDVTVAVLASDLQDGTATCDALATSNATVTEPTDNSRQTRQNGLVNVNLEDLVVLVPISVAANICDVDVVVLASEILLNDATQCTADAGSEGIVSGPAGGGVGSPTVQEGLVNVNVEDNTILVPIAVAANVCDVTVAVLVTQLQDGPATCDALASSDATVTEPTNSGGPTRQSGLVNVNVEDLVVQVPIAAAANICDVDVVLLATEILLNDATQCTADAGSEGVVSGPAGGGGGGGPTVQEGLVNVNVEDNTILVPIAVAANICDVTVAVLASQLEDGPATCDALATSDATVTEPTNNGGPTRQNGLVNVAVTDLILQVPVSVAANICDVDVVVLASEILLNDATICTASAGAEGIA
jgi:hypothetical protein